MIEELHLCNNGSVNGFNQQQLHINSGLFGIVKGSKLKLGCDYIITSDDILSKMVITLLKMEGNNF